MTSAEKSSVAFVHDHCFLLGADGTVYSEGKITDKVLERSHPLAEEIVIISRLRAVEDTTGLVALTDSRIRMAPVHGIYFSRTFGRALFADCAHMWREIGSARMVVLRLPCLLSVLAAPVLWLRSVPYSVENVGSPRDAVERQRRWHCHSRLRLAPPPVDGKASFARFRCALCDTDGPAEVLPHQGLERCSIQ